MGLGGRKRAQHLQMAAQDLERKLDHLGASKVERTLARGVFKQLTAAPDHAPLSTVTRRAMGSVVRSRKSADFAPIKTDDA